MAVRSPQGVSFFGIRPEMTYHEVGRAMGISHARVMQLERRALEKLRELCGADTSGDVEARALRNQKRSKHRRSRRV